MELIADGLLIATALTAGLYCLVLSRRLRNLTDSGEGIGAQIAALDRALAETRAALAETRDGVTDLRGSAKVSLSELARETAAASDLATRIEEAAARAEATMQRLYQAADRVEAHEARLARAGGDPDGDAADGMTAMVLATGDLPADGDAPVQEGRMAGEDTRPPPVELPEGPGDREGGGPDDSPAGETGGGVLGELPEEASARPSPPTRPRGNGAVLKAERMML